MRGTKLFLVTIPFAAWVLALCLVGSIGCGPPSSPGGGPSASGEIPEITDDIIQERILTTRVWEVPEENGEGQPITWNFRHSEPKEIAVIDKQMNGTRATIILEIKTQSSPRSREQRELAGQIRTEWELQTGWALRTWEIVNTENVSLKYKNLPKPPNNGG
jgi:hypothetical protein